MDILRINKLLQENEEIKQQIINLKRKLNLKNYQGSKKEEIKYAINKLKKVYVANQSICSNLSEINAEKFAKLVLKKLKKKDPNYRIKCANLNFAHNSKTYHVFTHYKNQTCGTFLVITNRDIQPTDQASLDDFNLIPISYMRNPVNSSNDGFFDLAVIQNQNIKLFNNPDIDNACAFISDIKTFNLGEIHKNYFNTTNKYHGQYMYKIGFGGNVVEYPPTLMLVINKPLYTAYTKLNKILPNKKKK